MKEDQGEKGTNLLALKKLVAQDKTQAALVELTKIAIEKKDKGLENECHLLTSRVEKLKQDQRKGLLTPAEVQKESNSIKDSILQLIDELNEPSQDKHAAQENGHLFKGKKMSWKRLFGGLAALIAVGAGIAEISGYSIRDWLDHTKQNQVQVIDEHQDSVAVVTPSPTPEIENSNQEIATTPEGTKEEKTQSSVSSQEPNGDELPPAKTKLSLQIRTNKGTDQLQFKEDEEVRLYFQVSRTCKLRTIYKLADGQLILLEDDRAVNAPEIGQWIELGDGFEVAPPFGVEELYVFAQEKDFPTLTTEEIDGYTFIKTGLPTALSKTRGLKKKNVFVESKLQITTTKN